MRARYVCRPDGPDNAYLPFLGELCGGSLDNFSRHIGVTEVSGVIEAMVSGIRADGEVARTVVSELRAAVLRHKMAFLRDQQNASDADRLAFGQLLGPVIKPHPTLSGDGRRSCRSTRIRASPTAGAPM